MSATATAPFPAVTPRARRLADLEQHAARQARTAREVAIFDRTDAALTVLRQKVTTAVAQGRATRDDADAYLQARTALIFQARDEALTQLHTPQSVPVQCAPITVITPDQAPHLHLRPCPDCGAGVRDIPLGVGVRPCEPTSTDPRPQWMVHNPDRCAAAQMAG